MKLRAAVLVIVLGVGCRPLEPGETRCSTMPIGGGYSTTRCRTGQAAPQPVYAPPANQPTSNGFWCATTASFGACFQLPVGCEKYRMIIADGCRAKPDQSCPAMTACFQQRVAACAPSGCFVDYPSCGAAEKSYGRDGSACVIRQ